jgi:S-methylmethionine-dependent homocysteine/selenocysteine methylase
MNTRFDEIVLLDGGMGQELTARSKKPPMPLWSTQVLLDEPELVEQAHYDFIMAGARVITLNAYTATPARLENAGLGAQLERLQADAIGVAKAAIARSRQTVRLAGCLPPLIASYRPDLAPDYDECLAQYRTIVALQKDAADLFLCETMPSIAEARAACLAARESGKTVWCAFTVDDADGTKLRSGEALADGLIAAAEAGADVVLVNCSTPEATDAAMPVMVAGPLPFGAYANGFTTIEPLKSAETVEVLEARRDITPDNYAQTALAWVEAGACIVGGCCEIGPGHIAALGQRLRAAGFTPANAAA